ncbi:MAG: hypothetical protein ACOZIN_19990 [Myxococcota bacterium]
MHTLVFIGVAALASLEEAPLSPPPLLEAPVQDFVKGELSAFLGSDRVVTKNNRLGVSLGLDRVGEVYYALLEPQVDLRFLEKRLAVGVGVPLRFEVFNFGRDESGQPLLSRRLGELRAQDYDEPQDFAKVLKYVTYGRKEDRLYLNVGQRYASSIGHGALVRRYAPNVDVDLTRVSAQLDAYNDYAGFELLTNDVVEWNLLSGLAFVKPLASFGDGVVMRSLSLGIGAAADFRAPRELLTDPNVGVRLLDEHGRMRATRTPVVLVGADVEVKMVKTREVDIKPYVDYSMLLGGDGGFTLGGLGRFNVGEETVHAFRAVLELRWLGSRYVPSYFDTFYEVERFVAADLPEAPAFPGIGRFATKYQDVMSGRLPQRLGYYVEGSYGVRGKVGFTAAIEGTSGGPEKNFVVHLEVPAVDLLQFFGSYYKRGFSGLGEVGLLDEKSVFFAGARMKLLPFLFVNGRAFKTFRVNPDVQRYDNTFGFALDVEVGYEFDGAPPAAAPALTEAS